MVDFLFTAFGAVFTGVVAGLLFTRAGILFGLGLAATIAWIGQVQMTTGATGVDGEGAFFISLLLATFIMTVVVDKLQSR